MHSIYTAYAGRVHCMPMHCLHRVVGGGVAAGRHHEVAEQGGAATGHGALEQREAREEVGRLVRVRVRVRVKGEATSAMLPLTLTHPKAHVGE